MNTKAAFPPKKTSSRVGLACLLMMVVWVTVVTIVQMVLLYNAPNLLSSVWVTWLVNDIPRNAWEMFQNEKTPDKPYDNGLLIYTIKSDERVVRYSKFNKFKHDEEPTMVKSDQERIINLYIGTPENISA